MNNQNLPSWRRSSPVRGNSLTSDFERMFADFFEGLPALRGMDFNPSCELNEDAQGYHLTLDIPGVKKEDVKLELNGNVLSISAERKDEKSTSEKKRHYSEISYGSYQRSFTLPREVDAAKVDAKFENGVLRILLPKSEGSKSKQISIQ